MNDSVRFKTRPSRSSPFYEPEEEDEVPNIKKLKRRSSDPDDPPSVLDSSTDALTPDGELPKTGKLITKSPRSPRDRKLFRTRSIASKGTGGRNDITPKNKKNKKLLPIIEKKPPMYVSDSWLLKWMRGSDDVGQSWQFKILNPKREFYLPIEIAIPMQLLVYEATSKDVGEIPVLCVLNGHVMRLFKGTEYNSEQKLIITFNLKEVSICMSMGKDQEKLLIVSRFHGRVFILQNPIDDPEVPQQSKPHEISSIYAMAVINCLWSEKFSGLAYPSILTAMLWKENNYICKEEHLANNNIGWGTYGGTNYYFKVDANDSNVIALFKNEDDNKPRNRLSLDGIQVFPAVNAKFKGILFNFMWPKKKEVIQMSDIAGLEKIVTMLTKDSASMNIFESRILKMASQYNSNPTPVEYKIHPQLYTTIKEEIIIKPQRQMSARLTQFVRQSRIADEASVTSEFGPSPGVGTDSSSSVGSVAAVVLKNERQQVDHFVADIIDEMASLHERLDGLEALQQRLTNIVDLESNRLGRVETKITTLLERGDPNTTSPNQPIDSNTSTLLDRFEDLEAKVDKLSTTTFSSPTNPLAVTAPASMIMPKRLSKREFHNNNEKVLELESKVDKISKLVAMHIEGSRQNRVDALETKLNQLLILVSKLKGESPSAEIPSSSALKYTDELSIINMKLDLLEGRCINKHKNLEQKIELISSKVAQLFEDKEKERKISIPTQTPTFSPATPNYTSNSLVNSPFTSPVTAGSTVLTATGVTSPGTVMDSKQGEKGGEVRNVSIPRSIETRLLSIEEKFTHQHKDLELKFEDIVSKVQTLGVICQHLNLQMKASSH